MKGNEETYSIVLCVWVISILISFKDNSILNTVSNIIEMFAWRQGVDLLKQIQLNLYFIYCEFLDYHLAKIKKYRYHLRC